MFIIYIYTNFKKDVINYLISYVKNCSLISTIKSNKIKKQS
jgi:hypothetical protein